MAQTSRSLSGGFCPISLSRFQGGGALWSHRFSGLGTRPLAGRDFHMFLGISSQAGERRRLALGQGMAGSRGSSKQSLSTLSTECVSGDGVKLPWSATASR
jgi:hypothetical protein